LLLGSVALGLVWGWLMVWLVMPHNPQMAVWRTAVWLSLYTFSSALVLGLLYTPPSGLIFLASTAVGATAHAITREIILEIRQEKG
jgi:hypothetical protein